MLISRFVFRFLAINLLMVITYAVPLSAQTTAASSELSALTLDYKRALFNAEDDSARFSVNLQFAHHFYRQKAFRETISCYEYLSHHAASSEVAQEYLVKGTITALTSGAIQKVFSLLYRADTTAMNTATKSHYRICKILLYLHQSDWTKTEAALLSHLSDNDASLRLYREWLKNNPPPKTKSKLIAKLLTIIPGAGMLYLGKYGSGLNALCVNSITAVPTYYAVRHKRLADASLYGMLFTRFYFGGWEVVEKETDRINQLRAEIYHTTYLQLLNKLPLLQLN